MKYLVSIAVGPVQDFIAAARKTRDLWYGSWLLSELSKSAALKLCACPGTEMIFPPPGADLAVKSDYTVVNKLLAIVEADSPIGVRAITAACEEAVRERLLAAWSEAKAQAMARLGPADISINIDLAEKQLSQITEFYAAWELLDGNYQKRREAVELRLAARKTLRDFPAHQGGGEIPKSSIDGGRESILRFPKEDRRNQFLVRHNEHLDAVGLLKRVGRARERRVHFESTLDVAARPYLARVINRHGQAAFDNFNAFLAQKGLAKSAGYFYPHESRQISNEALRDEVQGRVDQLKVGQPNPPYYALLIGDGDSMGGTISKIQNADQHRVFSRALSDFAHDVPEILDQHGAQAVYAGGDDVIALLPLHTAIDCAHELNAAFGRAVNGLPADLPRPTFSAGLAVAHALDPLTETRALAKSAEGKAKDYEGAAGRKKDALAIIVAPRSGSNVEAVGHWAVFLPKLRQIVGLYRQGELSPGLAHELRKLLGAWAEDDLREAKQEKMDHTLLPLARAIARKKHFHENSLALLEEGMGRVELTELMNLLFVARPFARAEKEAEKGKGAND